MKKRTFILLAFLFLQSWNFCVLAAPGTWRSYLSYHNATKCVVVNEKVYVVSNGSLYYYLPEDESITCCDKTNLLSDQGIRHMAVCEKSNTLVIIYENANIDLIRPDGSVVNITDYLNAFTLDPMVNDLRIVDGKAYLSTNFGATILNLEREEFGDTYMLGKVTNSCVEQGGYVYAATQEGLYRGDKKMNLLDAANWELYVADIYAQLEAFDDQLLALKSKDGVYIINPDSISPVDGTLMPVLLRKGTFNFMNRTDGKFAIGNKTYVYLYATLSGSSSYTFDGTVTDFVADGDIYWTTNGAKGLNGYRYNKKTQKREELALDILPDSPIRNYCQYLSVVDGGRLLVAGGNLNYFDYPELHRNGTLMMYENGIWNSFEEEGVAKRAVGVYRNITSIVQDPKDPDHHYASSFGQGIYEFRDMKFVRLYTHMEKEGQNDVVVSPLESAVPSSYYYTRISRLQYDGLGNLWISNADGGANVTCPLKFMKPDGTFVSLYYEELDKLSTVTEILFDGNGWIWVVSMQSPAQLYCIDTNGTLENTADDRVKVFREKFVDYDGGAVIINTVNDIVEDLNGDIWVMTDKGPYVLYHTENAFNDDFCFTKIKVPRNDGTNYADYLLDGAFTTCIEVDAANRKWIGTLNNGLYLIDGDDFKTVHSFTTENSPLPSNSIESLALDHSTGELYIGTSWGLVSYMSDATSGAETYIEENVYAYPNPVASYYDGLITVVGLKANSHVKVINTAGRLVAEGTSLGGSFTWDGRTPLGQRVATGIYYVLGTDEEGREGIVTKVLFIK